MMKIAILTWLHNEVFFRPMCFKSIFVMKVTQFNIDLNPSIFEKVKNCIQQGNPLISLLKEKMNVAKSKKSCPNVHAYALKENNIKIL